jgi:hypothetical protein
MMLSLIPLAGAAAWRAAGALGLPLIARRACAVAYALSPLALAGFFQGRFPDLVLVAALPALVMPLLRIAGLAPDGGWRSPAAGALGLAAVTTASPWAPAAVLGSGVLIALAAEINGERRGRRAALLGLAQSAAALLMLLPWSLELFRSGSPVGGHPGPFGVPLSDLVRLLPTSAAPIPTAMTWAFPIAAAAGVALAIESRERLARILALIGTGALLVAWAVARGVPWIAPRPGLPLTVVALCGAVLIGVAAEGLVPSLRSRSFGALHFGLGLIAGFGVAASLTGVAAIAAGNFDGLQPAGQLSPSFFEVEARSVGDFRVLWLSGTPRDLRADLSAPAGETTLTFLDRRAGPGERALEETLASVLARKTEQGGRLLAPFGVRYVILRPGAADDVLRAFARQVDIRFAQRFRGSQVLANEAWLPVVGTVSSKEWVAASSAANVTAGGLAAAPEDPGRAGALHRVRPGVFAGRVLDGSAAALLAEDFNSHWRLQTEGRTTRPTRAFGWAGAFPLDEKATAVVVSWDGQRWHLLALLAEGLLLAAIAAAWSRRAARERGER